MEINIHQFYPEQEDNTIDGINAKVNELLKRRGHLSGIRYNLYLAANNVKEHFNESKFNEMYIKPIDVEIKRLLKLAINEQV